MRICKVPLDVTTEQQFNMPDGAKILCVQSQNDIPCIWVMVNTAPPKPRRFAIYETGQKLPVFAGDYIGTFQLRSGMFIGHLFEIPAEETPCHSH